MALFASLLLSATISINGYVNSTIPTKTINTYDIREEIKQITTPIIDMYEYRRKIDILATAYTTDAIETGNGKGITASGQRVSRGMVATHKNIPFGTKLNIDTIGDVIVADRGGALCWIDNYTIRVDVFMHSRTDAFNFGVRKLNGYIYGIQK